MKEKFISSIENMIFKKTKAITKKQSTRKLHPMTFVAKSKKMAKLRVKRKKREPVERRKSESVDETDPEPPKEQSRNESQFNVIDVRTNN